MSDLTHITDLVATGNDDRKQDVGGELKRLNQNVQTTNQTLSDIFTLLNRGGYPASQSNFRNFGGPDHFQQQQHDNWNGWGGNKPSQFRNSNMNNINPNFFKANDFNNLRKNFLDEFEEGLLEGFLGSDFRKRINASFEKLAHQIDAKSIADIPNVLAKQVGKNAAASFRNSNLGKKLMPAADNFVSDAASIIKERGANAVTQLMAGSTEGAMSEVGLAGKELLSAAKPLLKVAPELALAAGVVVGGLILLDKTFESLTLTVGATKKMFEAARKAGNREITSREQNVQLAKTRMEADYKVLIEQPFKILEEAAQNLYNSWNQNLTVVSATQGYDKADVQDLMSAFADRLRQEGLSSYISGADMFDNLAKVLQAGMSGKIAEEFAYQATVLGKAIPTQDFFNYAGTYASIAANAVRSGKSQSDAIASANESLQSFANSLLYASRELTGGFTTGLQNASGLYEEAAKIAQAAKSDNLAGITGTILAVQSYVGAVAPDIASSITDTLYKTLTGGNSADIVALRSLANINASNTEFLRAFANNPQKIFATMFENLAKMYTDSNDAYMEKAEGYAQLFGLTSEAFQRVDFADLASAIRNMNLSSASLDENMQLLMDGQTTTTAEQLKAQQINQYMIEEGLSYVIDNQAAQLIQQHMWDEQMARQLMESEYSVALKGAAMEALEMIQHAVQNIINLINPLGWTKKLGNLITTAWEGNAQEADVRQLLELGKVGKGNATSLYQLTTRNADLHLTRSLIDMMGGKSKYGKASDVTKFLQSQRSIYGLKDVSNLMNLKNAFDADSAARSAAESGVGSKYVWGSISKSQGATARSLLNTSKQSGTLSMSPELLKTTTASGNTAASASASAAKAALDKMLADNYLVDQFVSQNKSYADWASSGAKYGIANMSEALQSAGYTEESVKQYFQDKETEQAAQQMEAIRQEEKLFRDTGVTFWGGGSFPTDFQAPLLADTATMLANHAVMIEYQNTMVANQAIMLANHATMIEKFVTMIDNQQSWSRYFKDTWEAWSGESGIFRKAVLTEGWNGVFRDKFLGESGGGSLNWSAYTSRLNTYFPENPDKDFKKFFTSFGDFYTAFVDYFIKHAYYSGTLKWDDSKTGAAGSSSYGGVASNGNGYTMADVERIKEEKQSSDYGDTLYALADMLTQNQVDLEDPVKQTNALLAQILVVASAIMQQTNQLSTSNTTSTLTIPDSMSLRALGVTTTDTTITNERNIT